MNLDVWLMLFTVTSSFISECQSGWCWDDSSCPLYSKCSTLQCVCIHQTVPLSLGRCAQCANDSDCPLFSHCDTDNTCLCNHLTLATDSYGGATECTNRSRVEFRAACTRKSHCAPDERCIEKQCFCKGCCLTNVQCRHLKHSECVERKCRCKYGDIFENPSSSGSSIPVTECAECRDDSHCKNQSKTCDPETRKCACRYGADRAPSSEQCVAECLAKGGDFQRCFECNYDADCPGVAVCATYGCRCQSGVAVTDTNGKLIGCKDCSADQPCPSGAYCEDGVCYCNNDHGEFEHPNRITVCRSRRTSNSYWAKTVLLPILLVALCILPMCSIACKLYVRERLINGTTFAGLTGAVPLREQSHHQLQPLLQPSASGGQRPAATLDEYTELRRQQMELVGGRREPTSAAQRNSYQGPVRTVDEYLALRQELLNLPPGPERGENAERLITPPLEMFRRSPTLTANLPPDISLATYIATHPSRDDPPAYEEVTTPPPSYEQATTSIFDKY